MNYKKMLRYKSNDGDIITILCTSFAYSSDPVQRKSFKLIIKLKFILSPRIFQNHIIIPCFGAFYNHNSFWASLFSDIENQETANFKIFEDISFHKGS